MVCCQIERGDKLTSLLLWKSRVRMDGIENQEAASAFLLIATSILTARKLAQVWDGRPSPALEAAISDAISQAERILAKIDARWPTAPPRSGAR
jgi:hypothetical protein